MSLTCAWEYNKMLNIVTNLLKEKFAKFNKGKVCITYSFYNFLWHHHPDCYIPCWLIFLPCICFASVCAITAAKSYILNYMWMAANFIMEGLMWPQVVHRWSSSLGPGLDEVSQKGLELLHLWCQSFTKNQKLETKKFFFIADLKTCWVS